MTKEEAIALYDSKWWESCTPDEIVRFQLYEERLCIPFDVFQLAIEKCLGRPVWTHEFAGKPGQASLQAEFEKRKGKPSLNEIMDMIPAEKRIVVVLK